MMGQGTEKIEERDEIKTVMNPPGERSTVDAVGVDSFRAMGMHLLQGRTFQRLDGVSDAEKVVIIDQSLARQLRPNGDALGCLIQYGWRPSSSSPSRVVGVVRSLRIVTDDDVHGTQIYVPMGPDCQPAFIHLRVASTARGTEAALLRRIPAE